jgi:hypothetical protein
MHLFSVSHNRRPTVAQPRASNRSGVVNFVVVSRKEPVETASSGKDDPIWPQQSFTCVLKEVPGQD